jgi:hypothetical protein
VKSKKSSRRTNTPDRKVIETPQRSLSDATVPRSSTPSPNAAGMSEAVNRAVTEHMKTTFGTQDQQLQDRFLWQAANILPDFAISEEHACDYVAAALRGITPRDSLEGMLAVQMVALHSLAMELIRRAAFSGQTDLGVEVSVNRVTMILRTFTSLTEVLSRYRGKVEQKMTVEHVHVYQGGQAIMGQVSQNNNEVKLEGPGKDDRGKLE